MLQGVIDGTEKRVIIEMPPRHGKSELVSRRLPAGFLAKNPDKKVIQCSYSANLASKENRKVQRLMLSQQFRTLFPDVKIPTKDANSAPGDRRYVRNNQQFEIVGKEGQYICAGIGGPITGEGMHLGIIDDPIKNAEEADSETFRENIWDWFNSTFMTREEGDDVAIVICATRWHEDDLIGRILAEAALTGEKWTVIKFEALREDMSDPLDPRKEGEALWQAKFSTEKMRKTKERLSKTTGLRWWEAMYQQRPAPPEGSLIKRAWFQEYDPADPGVTYQGTVLSMDTAMDTNSANDWSVSGTFRISEKYIDLENVWREKVEAPDLKQQAQAICYRDMPNAVLIERKASGIGLIQELKRDSRIPIWHDPANDKPGVVPDKDKRVRVNQAAPSLAQNIMRVPKNAPWVADFLNEVCNFPNTKHDDQTDMLTQFINWWRQHWVKPRQKLIQNKAQARSQARRI